MSFPPLPQSKTPFSLLFPNEPLGYSLLSRKKKKTRTVRSDLQWETLLFVSVYLFFLHVWRGTSPLNAGPSGGSVLSFLCRGVIFRTPMRHFRNRGRLSPPLTNPFFPPETPAQFFLWTKGKALAQKSSVLTFFLVVEPEILSASLETEERGLPPKAPFPLFPFSFPPCRCGYV